MRDSESNENSEIDSLKTDIFKYQLTPKDLQGGLYRPGLGSLVYIAFGISFITTIGIWLPAHVILQIIHHTMPPGDGLFLLAIIFFGGFLTLALPVVNTAQCICDFIVFHWLARQGIGKYAYHQDAQALQQTMPGLQQRLARFSGYLESLRSTPPA